MSTVTVKPGADGKLGTCDDEYYINGKFVGVGLSDQELNAMTMLADSGEIADQSKKEGNKKSN